MKKGQEKSEVHEVDQDRLPEWDKGGRSCALCCKTFGVFSRKHHCRNCGRIVCESCSQQRLVLSLESYSGKPQRVCTGCYKILTKKKLIKADANTKKEKEDRLLQDSSKISESLVKVFLMDGSFKTIGYDESTRACDVVKMLCFSVHIALFEVEQDWRDPEQFRLIPRDEFIHNVTKRWDLSDRRSSKLVLPIYDISSTLPTRSPPMLSAFRRIDMLEESSVESRRPLSMVSSGPSKSLAAPVLPKSRASLTDAANDNSSDDENPKELSCNEADILRSELDELKKKYEILRSIVAKGSSGGSSTPQPDGTPFGDRFKDRLMPKPSFSDWNQSLAVNSIQNADNDSDGGGSFSVPQELPNSSVPAFRRGSSLLRGSNRNPSGDVVQPVARRSFSRKSLFGSPGTAVPAENAPSDVRGSFSGASVGRDKDRDATPERERDRNAAYKSSYSVNDTQALLQATRSAPPHPRKSEQSRQFSSMSSPSSPIRTKSASELLMWKHGSIFSDEDLIAATEKALSSTTSSKEFTLLVRTYFHQLDSIEAFITRFDDIFRSVIQPVDEQPVEGSENPASPVDGWIVAASTSSSVKALITPIEQKSKAGHPVLKSHEALAEDPDMLVQLYEMASAMDGLYEFLLRVAEDWNKTVKSWLLRQFKLRLSLPVVHPDLLRVLVHCLAKENMLEYPEVVGIVGSVLDSSIAAARGQERTLSDSVKSNTEATLGTVFKMTEILNLIIGDLVPVLPLSFNVMMMYQERAFRVLRDDIMNFYVINKNNLNEKELLQLLTFAHQHLRAMSKFGLDTSSIADFSGEILKQLLSVIQMQLKVHMARIQQSDEKAPALMGDMDGAGLRTPWSTQLAEVVVDMLILVSKQVQQATARLQLSIQILETSMEYIQRQAAVLEKLSRASGGWTAGGLSGTSTVEKLCAFSNNCLYFAKLLDDAVDGLTDDLTTFQSEKLCMAFSSVTKQFRELSPGAMMALGTILATEVRELLRQGLFRSGWESSSKLASSIQSTISSYCSDLLTWLSTENSCQMGVIVQLAAESISETYVEMLLTTGLQTSPPGIWDRLDGDVKIIASAFEQYKPRTLAGGFPPPQGFQPRAIEEILKPLKDCVAVLGMQMRLIPEFVRSELYSDFGTATIKIWQTLMGMRGESKMVIDAVFEVIMKGWSPSSAVVPLNAATFIDKMKSKKKW